VGARRFSLRTSLNAELALSQRLSVSATGALRCFDTSESQLDACRDSVPSGRAGGRYQLGDVDLYTSVGHYYRLPTLRELYGAALLVRGSDGLVPEVGDSIEVGTRYQQSRPGRSPLFWVDLAGFARRSDNLVTHVRTAQGYLH